MNEEIEYAEMLEIPVSTVNVVRKKRTKKRKLEAKPLLETPLTVENPDLKESVIAQVNDKLSEDGQTEQITADADLFAEGANSGGSIDFSEDIPERIDTVRLYSAREKSFRKKQARLYAQEYAFDNAETENDGGRYAMNFETPSEKRARIVLGVEFAAACVLCGAIFLTNVFMPGSAINTFFRTLSEVKPSTSDTRPYTEFTLSSIVSEYSDVELTLSDAGVLTFQAECCVYPAADGKVSAVEKAADGTYTLRIAHSDTFSGVIGGLVAVYYEVGDSVKANVPVGFSSGETEVQVTMYSSGELLNCFEITEENCLAWLEQE